MIRFCALASANMAAVIALRTMIPKTRSLARSKLADDSLKEESAKEGEAPNQQFAKERFAQKDLASPSYDVGFEENCAVGKFTGLCGLEGLCSRIATGSAEAQRECWEQFATVKGEFDYMDDVMRSLRVDPEYLEDKVLSEGTGSNPPMQRASLEHPVPGALTAAGHSEGAGSVQAMQLASPMHPLPSTIAAAGHHEGADSIQPMQHASQMQLFLFDAVLIIGGVLTVGLVILFEFHNMNINRKRGIEMLNNSNAAIA